MAVLILFGVALCVILLFLFIFPYHWMSWKSTAIIDKIPGPKKNLYFGNADKFAYIPNEEFFGVFMKLEKEFGPVYRLWISGIPYIMSSNLRDIEAILGSKTNITKSIDYDLLLPWLGTGLLTSTGTKWRHHRRLLTPSFHFDILKNYIEIFSKNSEILVDILKKRMDDPFINISKYINLCTLDSICETAMGTNINALIDTENRYVKNIKRIGELYFKHTISFLLHRTFIWNISSSGREYMKRIREVQAFTKNVIKNRKAENKRLKKEGEDLYTGEKKRLTFLDLLLESAEQEGGISDEEIREEVDTFMFEGHDTTSVGLSWNIFLLGLHPEIQNKVYEELFSIYGDSDRPTTADDLKEMKYLECVIKESMRIYPPVPFISRRLDADIKIPSGYVLPAGTNFNISPYLIHRKEELYPDPEKFDPDRFLPEKTQSKDPYSYLPFSAGPRNCIGQRFAFLEMKVVLSSIIRNFEIKSLGTRQNVQHLLELVLRPQHGIRIKLAPRNSTQK